MLDVDRYAERIGWSGPRTPTEQTLAEVHFCHATHIPFECLDIHLGRRIAIDADSVFDKLVAKRRGGYCFEQNGLLLEALRAVGFCARPLAGRVTWQAAAPRPRTHMLLLVEIDGRSFLADAGFGTHALLRPLPFVPGVRREVEGETFCIAAKRGAHGEALYELQVETREGLSPLYVFTLDEQLPIDFEMANWFTSTHPSSLFVRSKVVSRVEPGRRWLLLDRDLKVTDRTGSRTTTLPDEAAYRAALAETFGILLDRDDILRW
jgi:N-hydroxyarylamine O-acetyltransferase